MNDESRLTMKCELKQKREKKSIREFSRPHRLALLILSITIGIIIVLGGGGSVSPVVGYSVDEAR